MVLPIFKQNYCFTLYRLSLFLGLKPLCLVPFGMLNLLNNFLIFKIRKHFGLFVHSMSS